MSDTCMFGDGDQDEISGDFSSCREIRMKFAKPYTPVKWAESPLSSEEEKVLEELEKLKKSRSLAAGEEEELKRRRNQKVRKSPL